jgi:hypothetical protein
MKSLWFVFRVTSRYTVLEERFARQKSRYAVLEELFVRQKSRNAVLEALALCSRQTPRNVGLMVEHR